MAEMIILPTIKNTLCSWRNFHPDAAVSKWIVITIKSCCSYLFLFAYVQKTQLFSQIKPGLQNAAQDSQSSSEKKPFCGLLLRKLRNICNALGFITEQFYTFYLQSTFLCSFSPSLLSWNKPWESTLCQALEKQRTKRNSLFPKGTQILRSKEFTPETGFSQK